MQNIIFIKLFKINNIKVKSKIYRLQNDRVHVIICLYGCIIYSLLAFTGRIFIFYGVVYFVNIMIVK